MQIVRMIAKMPTLGAWAFRHAQGKPYVYPDNDLGYTANFLSMLFKMSEQKFEADERLVKALDVLFILHADHEQNCSTNAVRSVGSSQVDPYSAVAAGVGALYGPLHGGANEAVLRMLRRIGSMENIPDFIEGVKDGNERLMGFGHRVYKNYDPRAKIIKKACDDVFEVTGVNPLLEIAQELEKIALEDEYFVKRKLYPNVDFYSGLIYEAFQFPPEMFTVLFAIGRTPGWLAQWLELVQDKEQKIARPKQIYTGDRDPRLRARLRALERRPCQRAGITRADCAAPRRACGATRGLRGCRPESAPDADRSCRRVAGPGRQRGTAPSERVPRGRRRHRSDRTAVPAAQDGACLFPTPIRPTPTRATPARRAPGSGRDDTEAEIEYTSGGSCEYLATGRSPAASSASTAGPSARRSAVPTRTSTARSRSCSTCSRARSGCTTATAGHRRGGRLPATCPRAGCTASAARPRQHAADVHAGRAARGLLRDPGCARAAARR